MARQTSKLVIPGVKSDTPGQRDDGKTFLLTEMWAYEGQDWAMRLIQAAARGGLELPDNAAELGMAGLAAAGLKAVLSSPHATVKPLLDEMLRQAVYTHKPSDPKWPTQAIEPGPNCPVEEIKTFVLLHKALLELHLGFFAAAKS